jgi:hypothetical protein
MNRVSFTHLTLSFVCVALFATGCATTPSVEVPPQAVSGLLEIRSALIDGKGQIQKTTGAAKDMIDRPRQDVQAQINGFNSQLEKLDKDAAQVRELTTAVQARTDEYFATWDTQLKTKSGSLAESGKQRRQESMASWAQLQASMTAGRAKFQSYITNLREAARYFQTDATAAGVKAATPTLRAALDREPEVLKTIDEVIVQIDAVRGGK